MIELQKLLKQLQKSYQKKLRRKIFFDRCTSSNISSIRLLRDVSIPSSSLLCKTIPSPPLFIPTGPSSPFSPQPLLPRLAPPISRHILSFIFLRSGFLNQASIFFSSPILFLLSSNFLSLPRYPSPTVIQKLLKSRCKYWATRSSARLLAGTAHSFARTAHSFACSALLASLARTLHCALSFARSLAHPLAPELMGQWNIFVQFSRCPESLCVEKKPMRNFCREKG